MRRGHFWIPGERGLQGKTCQRGSMYVEWEAPEMVTRPWPIILMHGNGHGLIYEQNSDAALAPVLRWIEAAIATHFD